MTGDTDTGTGTFAGALARFRQDGDICHLTQAIPYARTFGFTCETDAQGLLTVARFRDTTIGNTILPAIHGGVLGALLEQAATLHLINEMRVEALPRIINISVDYLRPAGPRDTFARGRVIKQGRRIANVRVEAWQDRPDKPVAAAHAHFLLG